MGRRWVDIVLECTGFIPPVLKHLFIYRPELKGFNFCASRERCKTVVYNVNHETIEPKDDIISAGSWYN